MGVFLFLTAVRHRRRALALVDALVQQHGDDFWRMVSGRVVGMGEAEAKGYSRSRAQMAADAWVEDALAEQPRLEPLHDFIAAGLADKLVQLSWLRTQRARQSTSELRFAPRKAG